MITCVGVLALSCWSGTAIGGDWGYRVTPYIWVPSIEGQLNYGFPPGSAARPTVDVDSGSLLEALDFAAMLSAEARKGRFSLGGDLIYLALSTDNSAVRSVSGFAGPGSRIGVSASLDTGTATDLKGALLTFTGGYSLFDEGGTRIDGFGGVRYFHVDVTTDFRLTAAVNVAGLGTVLSKIGSVNAEKDLVDGIVGVKGRIALGEGKWSLPYYVDIGAGSSNLTWQTVGGVAYSFNKFEVTAAYRHLYYDQGDDGLIQDFSFSGPLLAASFQF